jgi:hypothetical protein
LRMQGAVCNTEAYLLGRQRSGISKPNQDLKL